MRHDNTKCNYAYWLNKLPHTDAIVMIGQMQFQKVFHNLDFLRCERINARAMRGNAMGWYYHHKWDGNGMGWDGSRNFVPITTSYHPITITVICTTHQLPVGGMSAYTIPSTFPSHHPELLPIPSTTHLSNFQPSHHILPIFSHPDTTAQQSFSWIFPGRQAPYPP